MTGSSISPLLIMLYDRWFEASNNVFVGYTDRKLDGTIDVDIVKEDKVSTFNVKNITYDSKRYIILYLQDKQAAEVEVFDTLTGKKIGDEIKGEGEIIMGFICNENDIPYTSILEKDMSNKCVIMNDSFEPIKTTYRMISNTSIKGDLYCFDGMVIQDKPRWERIKMNKYTGEIIERKEGTKII